MYPICRKQKNGTCKLTGVQPYFDEAFYVGFDFNGCELGLHPQDETVTPATKLFLIGL